MSANILVVDDDPHIRDVIAYALEQAGMTVKTAGNGQEGLAHFSSEPVQLIVLDVGMPVMDGLQMCREIRKSSEVPILFLSARDDEVDRIVGLEIGGDDYVTKPFSPRELMARVKTILKRARHQISSIENALKQGRLLVDQERREATLHGAPLNLTTLEFAILARLMERPGVVFSRREIIESAYGAKRHLSDRTVDSHVRNIRAKCANHGCKNVIETVHGVGFRLGACENAE
ncbi:response regulator [Hoeflea sp. TYP-13]|uniref:response regulator n=1 Tax=Hoeflea sp. TYP-13 TaxID=3230023 RepID=UPI0034C6735F